MQQEFAAVAFSLRRWYNEADFAVGDEETVRKGLSQEGLKLIACASMLLDHIGAVLVPWGWLRVAGRLAFPIYCFLLCEGIDHTHSARRYGSRLAAVAVLAEIPFDLLFYGKLTAAHQNVMITLILGFLAVKTMERVEKFWLKAAAAALAVLMAELLGSDYGGLGVLLILVMALVEEKRLRWIMMAAIFAAMGSIELFALLALIPINLYSGRQVCRGRWIRWGFYLFYPAHIAVLLLLDKF